MMKTLTLFTTCLLFTLSSYGDVAVIVHPSNPLTSLSQKQVQRLFLGRMHMFPDSNVKVDSIDQIEGSSVYENFYKLVINLSASKLKRYRAYYMFSGKGKLPSQTDSQSVVDHVSTSVNAISYIPMDEVDDRVKVVYVSHD